MITTVEGQNESPDSTKPMLGAGAGMGEGYYLVNGKKILYWDGEKWMKPAKDNMGKYGVWLNPLEKQPRIKTAEYDPKLNKGQW